MNDNIFSVSELNNYTSQLVAGDMLLSNAYVLGEISNCNNHYSGHIYFTLKDQSASIKAVMFKSSAIRLNFKPENGMMVLCCGRVGIYEKDGAYQLYVNQMQTQGVGGLNEAYEQLKAKLDAQGLFSTHYKKAIPPFPKSIAVVTSPTGAAVQDIQNVIKRRYPLCDIILCPVKVQGEGSAEEIIKAIETATRMSIADIIIIGRGGGSIEDLWSFNNELLALAIYSSKIPIISGVGHETDFTISDFVADLRAPTPSAAAELATPDISEINEYIHSLDYTLSNIFIRKINDAKVQYDHLVSRPVLSSFDKIVRQKMASVVLAETNLYKALKMKLAQNKTRLENLSSKMTAVSSQAILERGFAYIELNNKLISDAKALCSGDEISITFKNGSVTAIIK